MSEVSAYEPLLEKMTQHFTSDQFGQEVVSAKRDFFESAGILNDESSDFELRMSQFLDWYLFTRELSDHQVSPVKYALYDKGIDWTESEKQLVDNLEGAKHSLFEYIKNKGNDIYVKDLFAGKKVIVKDSPITMGFSKEEVFEARLLPLEDNFVFTKGFCFHPAEAKKFILKEIKKVKKLSQVDKEALMLRLLKMRYKHEQYGHIRLDYIYTNDAKLKF